MNSKYALALLMSTVTTLGIYHCLLAQAPIYSWHSAPAIAVEPPAATSTQEKIAFRRKTLRTMRDELGQIADLVKAENFRAAQATFEKALKKWYTFGGTVKRIAPDSYAKISPNFNAVKKGLYQSSVPLSTLKANLQTLIQDVNVAVPISDAKE